MPHLPWYLFGYFESIWIHTAKFVTDYNNVNVFRTKRPPCELDIEELKNAVMVTNMIMDHFKKHVATATPDISSPRLFPSSKKDLAVSKHPIHAQSAAARVASANDTDDKTVVPVPEK